MREALERVNDEIVTVPGLEVRTIVLGGEALALRVCEELASISGRDGTFVAVTSFDDVGAHEQVLMLFPVWRYHRDAVQLHAATGAL